VEVSLVAARGGHGTLFIRQLFRTQTNEPTSDKGEVVLVSTHQKEPPIVDNDTSFSPHGKHLIAGHWVSGEQYFHSDPAYGHSHAFSV